jgi:hypothetical protein
VSQSRKTALIAGVLFLITFTAIPAVLLYDPVLNNAKYIVGSGSDTRVFFGAFIEIIVAIANIGTAVVLYPILKRQSGSVALGYVASRTLESTVIVAGIISLLAVVTLRQDLAGGSTDHNSLILAGKSLVAFHKATFLIGPAFCSSMTGMLLGYLMYKSALVPRPMAVVGMIGGILAFVAATLPLFNVFDQGSGGSVLLTFPEIVWELFLGIYLTFWGFRPSPILTDLQPS